MILNLYYTVCIIIVIATTIYLSIGLVSFFVWMFYDGLPSFIDFIQKGYYAFSEIKDEVTSSIKRKL